MNVQSQIRQEVEQGANRQQKLFDFVSAELGEIDQLEAQIAKMETEQRMTTQIETIEAMLYSPGKLDHLELEELAM